MAGLDVTALLLTRGDAHYGEAVTQRDHALQCAALASRAGADDELVLAAFVPARVAWLIEHHVVAKRYLCAVDPSYAARLSAASVDSLRAQGGPLGKTELTALEAHPWFEDALRLRRWDEEAKDRDARVAPLASWVPLLEQYFGPQTIRFTRP